MQAIRSLSPKDEQIVYAIYLMRLRLFSSQLARYITYLQECMVIKMI